jgi:hypothetical protein
VALTVSAPIRIVALVGLLLAVGAGGAMRFMGGGSGSPTSVVPSQNSAVLRAKSVAAKASARAKNPTAATTATATAPTTHKTVAPATHPTVTAKPKPAAAAPEPAAKPATAPKHLSAALSAGLPVPLAQALAANPTVVVALYNPQSEVDGIAFAEARAGAALAGAGFIGLNVLSQAQVGKLTEQLGVLPDPAVLVFTRPAHLGGRIDGFADKETVAQAAQNAASGS